jgi:aldose 1-epimerase
MSPLHRSVTREAPYVPYPPDYNAFWVSISICLTYYFGIAQCVKMPKQRNEDKMPGKWSLGAGLAGAALMTMAGWATPASKTDMPNVRQAPFGQTATGQKVDVFTLTNKNRLEAKIITFGGAIISLKVPDRTGKLENIVLGFDTLAPYLAGVPYFGAVIGRYGNRIANGKFTIGKTSYQLPLNDGPNSLHGGFKGFDKVVWQAAPFEDKKGPGLRLTYVSPDGDAGYPGKLTVHVTYHLTADNALSIDYQATTTKTTPVNLTNHSYFNLSGNSETSILDQKLTIKADTFTPVSNVLIPTGELKLVTDTPFDFRKATAIGARIEANDEQLNFGRGYDHNWVLVKPKAGAMTVAAILSDPASGREMEIRTTEPGLQFYSGNFLDGKAAGTGTVFKHRTGLCLETQHFPDSPNHANFPSTLLKPGQHYSSHTVLVFRTEN